ncbi:pyridoxal-phosphate dependent enzyme [Streptomyces sp. NPDC051567]|uniref:pyridoxal-phosphate dependent enzyme n=1 Tax=Streptomyces sp. NPDC051567 TaxID=3365660 RepID=UPI00379037F3
MEQHFAEAVGRPDLIRLDERLVCVRFETMKALSALAAVRRLLETGVVRPGDTLLDSSSGIYAHALALACHRHGMHCHIVGSTTVDHTLRVQLAVLGATFEQMEPCADLKLDQKRRVARVAEILAEHPGHHWMRQYHDPVHYLGYEAVADRIHAEVDDGPLVLVGGVGTGASTGALAGYLRAARPQVRLVGVQPYGSVTFGAGHVSDPEIIIAGIGSSIPFENVAHELYDTIHWTGFDVARAGSVDLLRRHAVFAGLSSGAAYLAARWERELCPRATVVFVAPDTGHRYVDSVFAGHADVPPVAELAPREAAGPQELTLPWSRMDWAGSTAPCRTPAGVS